MSSPTLDKVGSVATSAKGNTSDALVIYLDVFDMAESWRVKSSHDIDDSKAIDDSKDVGDDSETPLGYLTVINGKLHHLERDGCTHPMTALPEVFKQWLKNDCQNPEKKEEWIKWLMDVPLDLSDHDNLGEASFDISHAPKDSKLATQQYVRRWKRYCEGFQEADNDKRDLLEKALEEDLSSWVCKKNIEGYIEAIRRSPRDGD